MAEGCASYDLHLDTSLRNNSRDEGAFNFSYTGGNIAEIMRAVCERPLNGKRETMNSTDVAVCFTRSMGRWCFARSEFFTRVFGNLSFEIFSIFGIS